MEKMTGAENVIWELSKIYKSYDDLKIKEDLNEITARSKTLNEELKGKIKTLEISPEKLLESLKEIENIFAKLAKIGMFAYLLFTEDNTSIDYKNLLATVEEHEAEIRNNLVFFDLEINEIEDEKFNSFVNEQIFAQYKHYLLNLRKFKPHMLKEEEEQLINKKNLTGKQALCKLYSELTSSFKFKITIDGEEKTLNASEIRALREHPDSKIREEAMKTYFLKFKENSLVIGNIFNSLLKDHYYEYKLRKYEGAISKRNLENELDKSVVDTLINVTSENAHLVSRYYKIKAKLLNVDKIKLSDIYAPVSNSQKTYTWNEAKEIVLSSYKKFDQKVGEVIEGFFNNNWIHAKLLPNKTAGAYCYGASPDINPYVMMNFTGTERDVMTLAHELGHGLHDVLASKQSMLNFHPTLPLAEVASVFGEMLVTDYLFSNLQSKEEKISLLASKLEESFATSFRQNMFARFELKTHKEISNRQISFDELSNIYMDELHLMFNDSVIYNDEYRWEWAIVHHMFHWPFYVYAYNFALLVVLALYQKYLEEGEKFKPSYFGILEAGSSKSPYEILSSVGIDLKDPDFWKKGFVLIEEKWLKPLEELLK